jgi:hypothetical protein
MQTTAADIQIGHTGLIGSKYYPMDKDILLDVNKTIFMTTIRNSTSWHILLEFEEDLWTFIEQGNQNRLQKMAIIDKYRRPDVNHATVALSRIYRPLPPTPPKDRTAELFTDNLAKFTGYILHYMQPDL